MSAYALLSVSVCTLLILITLSPGYFKESAARSISLCLTSVIPSLFLYMILTKITVSTGISYIIARPLGKLFNSFSGLPPCACGVYILSFISGYPSGVAASLELYESGEVNKRDAELLVAVCDNTGPALPIILIGSALNSVFSGIIIYIIQIISAICAMLIFRKPKDLAPCRVSNVKRRDILRTVTDSVNNTVKSAAQLCAYVIMFSVITDALVLVFGDSRLIMIIKPFLEICNGSKSVIEVFGRSAFPIICAATSFGGVCVHMQAATLCAPCGISLKKHFKLKLTEALLSGILAKLFIAFSSLR